MLIFTNIIRSYDCLHYPYSVDSGWPEESYGGGNKVRAALDRAALPTAPRASRDSDVDSGKVPKDPPFTAFLGNLSYDVEREDVFEFFKDTKVRKQHTLFVMCIIVIIIIGS